MVVDLLIYVGGLVALAGWMAAMAWFTRRQEPSPVVAPAVSARARLEADHRQRLSRAHVSAVRIRHSGVVQAFPLSAEQRAALSRGKKPKS